jgi:hypothetical protein
MRGFSTNRWGEVEEAVLLGVGQVGRVTLYPVIKTVTEKERKKFLFLFFLSSLFLFSNSSLIIFYNSLSG